MRSASDRFATQHRCGWPAFAKRTVRRSVIALSDRNVQPLRDHPPALFVVGCGHSGTTLLASLLGRRRDALLLSMETGLFLPDTRLLDVRQFTDTLFGVAHQLGKSILIEKTPKHVHCIARIRRLLPQARIVGIARNPLDNCASLYKRVRDLDLAVERWVIDNTALASARRQGLADVIRYEDLCADSSTVTAGLCNRLGWHADEGAQDDAVMRSDQRRATNAHRKARFEQVEKPIYRNEGTYARILSPSQIARVRQATATLAEELGYRSSDQAQGPVR